MQYRRPAIFARRLQQQSCPYIFDSIHGKWFMRMNALELITAIEDRFGIVIDETEAGRIKTVGDLNFLILDKLKPQGSDNCLSSHVFYRLRKALEERCSASRSDVVSHALLSDLIPESRRRETWKSIAKLLGWQLPELQRSAFLGYCPLILFFAIIALAGIGETLGLIADTVAWILMLGAAPLVWLCLKVTAPLGIHFPAGCETVGKMVEPIVALNFAQISKETGATSEREVWSALRSTIIEHLGVQPRAVVREASFSKDLCRDRKRLWI
jgi:hypothetical protein